MNIHRALADIAEIRAQLDRTESYRGFRSTAVAVSVIFVLAGAWAEQLWFTESDRKVDRYLVIWLCVAVASALVAMIEMLVRSRVSKNELVTRMHWTLIRQIAPGLLIGFVLTCLIVAHALEQDVEAAGLMWALPGVWSMMYGVGLYACYNHLPIQSMWVAVYFLVVGVLILAFNWSTRELAGWQMVGTFGVGQAFLASVLFWNLERRRDETES